MVSMVMAMLLVGNRSSIVDRCLTSKKNFDGRDGVERPINFEQVLDGEMISDTMFWVACKVKSARIVGVSNSCCVRCASFNFDFGFGFVGEVFHVSCSQPTAWTETTILKPN